MILRVTEVDPPSTTGSGGKGGLWNQPKSSHPSASSLITNDRSHLKISLCSRTILFTEIEIIH